MKCAGCLKKKPLNLLQSYVVLKAAEKVLKAAQSCRNVTSADLDISDPSLRVFFNERLTKENRMLFRDALVKCKQNGFAQCSVLYCSHEVIFIRKTDGKPATPVHNFVDLDKSHSNYVHRYVDRSIDFSYF